MREGIKKSDHFKLDITTARLTLALADIATYTFLSENSIRVFGIDGVGGIKSEKVAVQIKGKNAKVWLDPGLYYALSNKVTVEKGVTGEALMKQVNKELYNPDELAKIPGFRNYVPIFKALSNYGFSITTVTPAVNAFEIGSRLEDEYRIVSNIKQYGVESWVVRGYSEKLIEEAKERYEASKLKQKKTREEEKSAYAFRIKFESYRFEKELEKELLDMQEGDVNKILDVWGGKKVTVNGQRQIGVIVTDDVVIKIDRDNAKVFVDSNIYSKIESRFTKEGGTALDVCNAMAKDSSSVDLEFIHIAIILKALSESKIQVVEFSGLSKNELEEKTKLLLEQDWITSQYVQNVSKHRKASKETLSMAQKNILQKLLEDVGDPEKVNNALARYGIDARVEGVKVERAPEVPNELEIEEEEESEISLARVYHRFGSEGQLAQKILEKLDLMKNRMVDEKLDEMEIVGFGYLKTINIYNDVVIKVMKGKGDRAFVLMDKEFLSSAVEYAKTKREFKNYCTLPSPDEERDTLSHHIELLSGDERFIELIATFKAFNAIGVKHFIIKSRAEDASHYMDEVRETCKLPAMIHASVAKGTLEEIIKVLLQTSTTEQIISKLKDTGFEREAQYVEEYNKAKTQRNSSQGS
jgi:hypothetical protein